MATKANDLINTAIGTQYNELAQILLHVQDPSLPAVGPFHRRHAQETDVSENPQCDFTKITREQGSSSQRGLESVRYCTL